MNWLFRDQQKTQPITNLLPITKFGLESEEAIVALLEIVCFFGAITSRRRFIRDLCSDQIFKVSFFEHIFRRNHQITLSG